MVLVDDTNFTTYVGRYESKVHDEAVRAALLWLLVHCVYGTFYDAAWLFGNALQTRHLDVTVEECCDILVSYPCPLQSYQFGFARVFIL